MRDPARVQRILWLIKTIWEKNPDLRLCQLLGNCFGPGDHYYVEEDELEMRLRTTYGEGLGEEE